jgi:hypothetical protein
VVQLLGYRTNKTSIWEQDRIAQFFSTKDLDLQPSQVKLAVALVLQKTGFVMTEMIRELVAEPIPD